MQVIANVLTIGRITSPASTANLKPPVEYVPAPIVDKVEGAKVGIISLGSNDPAIAEARDRLSAAGVGYKLPTPARTAPLSQRQGVHCRA